MKVKTYCYQCVAGPDLLEVEVEDGVATSVTPNFDAAGIHPGGGRVCVKALRAADTAVFLVDQNARAALAIADRAYVLETGTITLSGTGAGLLADERVRTAYLGI